MKKNMYYLLVAFSIPVILLAVIFLIGAMKNADRIYIAAAFGLIGAGTFAFGYNGVAYMNFIAPENLEPLILRIARSTNGYFTAQDIMQRLNITSEIFEEVLNRMLSRGAVTPEFRDGIQVYQIAGLAVEAKRKCDSCGTEFNVRDAITKCPNCGGNIKIC